MTDSVSLYPAEASSSFTQLSNRVSKYWS
ncbi:hypothetical protein M3J09_011918 [Ascochyta lentis]